MIGQAEPQSWRFSNDLHSVPAISHLLLYNMNFRSLYRLNRDNQLNEYQTNLLDLYCTDR